MAELFMECEEEELEPWQQKAKPIVVDDDDDDDEPIFVGEILSSKPANTCSGKFEVSRQKGQDGKNGKRQLSLQFSSHWLPHPMYHRSITAFSEKAAGVWTVCYGFAADILNRINPNSSRIGMQNGATKRGAVAGSPGFHSATRSATSTLAVQPQPRTSSASGTSQILQRPLSECSLPQEAAKLSPGISQPIGRSATTQPLSRNLSIPGTAQSASRPVATVAAQPIALNRAVPNNTSGVAFGSRQSSGVVQCHSRPVANATGLNKRPSTSEANSITPKKAKVDEISCGSDPSAPHSVVTSSDTSLLQKGFASSNVKNGAPFPQACPKCNIHFNLLEPLKNHIKYCCPDMVHSLLGMTKTDCVGTPAKISESEKGKLIMLVNDFYYGKHEGNVQQVRQEQKTHTTFKCASCMKLLKSNIRFMNHMKHHLELEKQNSESWENHTTCQHCYRQFPTPFQLQCHIESTHTPHESSTLCKICELSFETEQVLLQHMKDNHKPGEMPYVCQVCNYRSSAFSDVEKHFRAVHENTKNLLCPFCLKVIKIGAPYMHHFMRHQKKGVQRCNKCRLQFLTSKERTDHKSQHHRTFKKPVQLEGLPPGTKVTIRASVGSLPPGSAAVTSPVSPTASFLQLSPGTRVANVKAVDKLNVNKIKPKLKPLSVQKRSSLGTASSSTSSNSSSNTNTNKKNNKIANTSLNNLRCPNIQKCIECYSDIRTFASHFPAYVRCSLCRYSTSCSKAYVNHMISFHGARQNTRFWIYKSHSEGLRGVTVVCLNCDFLADASGLDKMAAHLNESPGHTCQVIVENVPLGRPVTESPLDLVSPPLEKQGTQETPQKTSRPSTPAEQKEVLVSISLQRKDSVEDAKDETLEPPSDTDCEEGKVAALADSSQPGFHGSSKDHTHQEEEDQGILEDKGPLVLEGSGNKSPCLETISCQEFHSSSKDSEGGASLGRQCHKGPSAAACEEEASLPSGPEDVSTPGLPASTSNLTDPVAEEGADAAPGRDGECPLDAQHAEKLPVSRRDQLSDLQLCPCLEETASESGGEGPADKRCRGCLVSPPGNFASGCLSCSDDLLDPVGEGDAECLADQSSKTLSVAESDKVVLPSAPVNSVSETSTSLGNLRDPVGGEGGGRNGRVAGDEKLSCAQNGETVLPSVLENPSSPGRRVCSSSLNPAEGKGDASEMEVNTSSAGAEHEEDAAGRTAEACSSSEPATEAKSHLGSLSEEREDSLPESPNSSHAGLPASVVELPCGKVEPDGLAPAGPSEEGKSPRSVGKAACSFPGSEDAETALDDSDFAEVDAEDPQLASSDCDEVSFEQFLRRSDPASVNSDTSDQGSIRLEPLTPSEVLEHEATEILQKGGVASSAKKAGADSEQPDAVASGESSPRQLDTSTSQADESKEAS